MQSRRENKMNDIITQIIKQGGIFKNAGKHFMSVVKAGKKNYYVSTCYTFDHGWESMAFVTEQEVPTSAEDIDTDLVSSWAHIKVRNYNEDPELRRHEKFCKDLIKEKEGAGE